MAGDADVTEKLLKGHKVGDMTYKVHLDGYNLVPYLTGQAEKSPRESFLYCNDDQQVDRPALRQLEAGVHGAASAGARLRVWAEPFTTPARAEDLQPADGPVRAGRHHVEHLLRLAASTTSSCSSRRRTTSGKFLMTFKEYPQRQKAASFNLDEVMESLSSGKGH